LLGAPIQTVGPLVQIDPAGWNRELPAFELALPGDLSAAAFPLAAAQLVAGSRVTTRGVGVNPTRAGLLEIARDMGAGLVIEPQGERGGEPVAELHAWCEPLRAVAIGGETVERAMDEIPIACALAARAAGTTRVLNAERWRGPAGEPGGDRLGSIFSLLKSFGVGCEERPDGLVIEGREGPLDAADIDSRGDARIAMTAAVLGLVGRGPTRVRDAGCIAARYPKFVATLRALGARVDLE
jgi:3-phosphoshikimate 1-carboxyvinyltransferase